MPVIEHVVAFKSPDPAKCSALVKEMLALKDRCEKDGRKYIRTIKGGRQHSPEGKHHDTTVVFVVSFDSLEDRDYYLDTDPAHIAFKNMVPSKFGVEGVVVLDFTEGEF